MCISDLRRDTRCSHNLLFPRTAVAEAEGLGSGASVTAAGLVAAGEVGGVEAEVG